MRRNPTTNLILLLSLAGLALAGCKNETVDYNEASGLDGRRDTATRLFLGTSDDDRCNAEAGDHEDWRYLLIRQPGTLRVDVGLDRPDNVDADIYLHDGFGRAVSRVRVNDSDDYYTFDPLTVSMGRYYVRVVCKEGSSVYTVAAQFEAERPSETERRVFVFKEREKPRPVKPERKKRRRRRKGKPRPDPSPKTDTAPPPPAEPPPPIASAIGIPGVPAPPRPKEPTVVVGKIILMTTAKGKRTKVTIKNVGTKFGITQDMVGSLALKNRKIEVTLFKCERERCFGYVAASKDQLEEHREIKFVVDK